MYGVYRVLQVNPEMSFTGHQRKVCDRQKVTTRFGLSQSPSPCFEYHDARISF